jgi:hypothetical protein
MVLAWTAVEWATVLSAAFAAVAALAACAAVLLNLLAQRAAQKPNVSAGFLDPPTAAQSVRFANAGPGLAVSLAFLGVDDGKKYGGIVGKGFLHAGAEAEVAIGRVSVGKEAHFVWVCRDVRGRTHLWSYDERYESISSRKLRKMRSQLGDFFNRMYRGHPDSVAVGRQQPHPEALLRFRVTPTVTIDMKRAHPPEAADAFLGGHV